MTRFAYAQFSPGTRRPDVNKCKFFFLPKIRFWVRLEMNLMGFHGDYSLLIKINKIPVNDLVKKVINWKNINKGFFISSKTKGLS